jgi:hypothetical protein
MRKLVLALIPKALEDMGKIEELLLKDRGPEIDV